MKTVIINQVSDKEFRKLCRKFRQREQIKSTATGQYKEVSFELEFIRYVFVTRERPCE